MKTYIGIDNGTSGGLAIIQPNQINVMIIPLIEVGGLRYIDAKEVNYILSQFKDNSLVIYEQGAKNPYFGTIGNFSNGYHFGVIKTILEIGEFSNVCVTPKQWQKDMFLGIRHLSKGDTKGASIETCKRLFPTVDLRRTSKCKKDHDGIADALCMAEWARRKNM